MKILVIGDAMSDVYHVGTISRINPEKHSAPLVSIGKTVSIPGGAANVAANVESLGAKVTLCSGYGDIQKHRVVDEYGIICRFDYDHELQPITYLPDDKFNGIIVSDYYKGSITPNLIGEIKIKYKGCPIFVDTKGNPSDWSGATCLFPNQNEWSSFNFDYKMTRSPIFLKKGKNGADLIVNGSRVGSYRSKVRMPLNVSGAGDTVIAAFAVTYCALATQENAMHLSALMAMSAAGISVSQQLTYAPTLGEILSHFPEMQDIVTRITNEHNNDLTAQTA